MKLTLKQKELEAGYVLDLEKQTNVTEVFGSSNLKKEAKLTIKGSGSLQKLELQGELIELEIKDPLLKLEVFEAAGLSNKTFPAILTKCPSLKVIDWVNGKFDKVPKAVLKMTTLEQFIVDFTRVTFPVGLTKLYPLCDMIDKKTTLMFKSKIKLSDLNEGHMVKGMGAWLPNCDQGYGDNGETLIVDA
jgi:hypothetical protein